MSSESTSRVDARDVVLVAVTAALLAVSFGQPVGYGVAILLSGVLLLLTGLSVAMAVDTHLPDRFWMPVLAATAAIVVAILGFGSIALVFIPGIALVASAFVTPIRPLRVLAAASFWVAMAINLT